MSGPWKLPFVNTHSEPAPPFAVMQVVGAVNDQRGAFIEVTKPDGSGSQFIINGPTPAPKTGRAASFYPAVAAFDRTDPATDEQTAPPSLGQEWGAVEDSWKLHLAGEGFTIAGGSENGETVLVSPAGGATQNPIRKVVVSTTSNQTAGAPVDPIRLNDNDTRYFSGSLGGTDNIWIEANDNRRKGRLWLPALAMFTGVSAGTFDPHAVDSDYPEDSQGDGAERPLYCIDPLPNSTVSGYVSAEFAAADWSDLDEPVYTQGKLRGYKKDHQGRREFWFEITAENMLEEKIEKGILAQAHEEEGGFVLAPSCKKASGYSDSPGDS